MELQSERQLPWSRQHVWDALNNPEILQLCIPGCEALEIAEDGGFDAQVQAKVGPVKARFRGHVSIIDPSPPESYTLRFEGQGGAAGFARGEAEVHLIDADGSGSVLRYSARAKVGGKLAQIGSRLVQAAARKMADDFFDNFTAQLDGAAAELGDAPPNESKQRNWKFWNKAEPGAD